MFPILFSLRLPLWVGGFGWLEAALTAAALAGWLFWRWRRRREDFSWPGALTLPLAWGALRLAAALAGPGYEFELHTYGVLAAVGFGLGIWLAVRRARREGMAVELVLDLSFWILVSALVGSRLLYILVNLDEYIAEPLALVKIWTGGLVFYGGFLGAVAASFYFCRRRGVPFLAVADLTIPSVALGHVFGRLGCFSAGCCHGSPSSLPWAVTFTRPGTVVDRSHLLRTPLHPTQLYEALGELVLFFLLLYLRRRKRFPGQLLATWLCGYSTLRFVTEMFRGDVERGLLLELDLFGSEHPELFSGGQLLSIILFITGIWLLFGGRHRKSTPPPPTQPEQEKTRLPH